MHSALLGVRLEERSTWAQALTHVHHTYEALILLILVTTLMLSIERFLTVMKLRTQASSPHG